MTAPAQTMDPTETMVGTARGVGLWVAPPGTGAPDDIETAFAAPWLPLGYASDDGVTIGGDTTTEQFVPWQSTVPIRTVITERTKTLGFTLWQLNYLTLGLYFDQEIDNPGADAAFDFEVRSDSPQRIHAIAVDALDGERAFRLVYPRATLESTGDMTLNKGAMVPLEVTLNALDDNGTLVHIYLGPGPSAAGLVAPASTAQQPAEAA